MRFVNAFGVELEGGWDDEPEMSNRLIGDGSVTVDGQYHVGELPSPILRSLSALRGFVDGNYPDHVGESCGLHIHLSFRPQINGTAVSVIAESEDYWRFLKSKLEAWGRKKSVRNRAFWKRLNGENSFCQTVYDASPLLGGGDRYHAVNFCAFHEHGTIEIRVLPAFQSPRLAIGALHTVIKATDVYLAMRFPSMADFDAETVAYDFDAEEATAPEVTDFGTILV